MTKQVLLTKRMTNGEHSVCEDLKRTQSHVRRFSCGFSSKRRGQMTFGVANVIYKLHWRSKDEYIKLLQTLVEDEERLNEKLAELRRIEHEHTKSFVDETDKRRSNTCGFRSMGDLRVYSDKMRTSQMQFHRKKMLEHQIDDVIEKIDQDRIRMH